MRCSAKGIDFVSFLKSIYTEYKDDCSHRMFIWCTRAVGNLARRCMWFNFITAKHSFQEFESAQEAICMEGSE